MSERKSITQLPVSETINPQDLMLIVQDGVTKQVTVAQIPKQLVFEPLVINGETVYEMSVNTP